MMLSWIPLVGDLIGGVRDHFKHKSEIKKIARQGEIELKKATNDASIKRAQSGDEAAGNLDQISLKDRGYKDDYLLILVTIPLIMSFIPSMVSFVEDGFKVLDMSPEYYKWILLGVYIDTFGFRRILRIVLEKWINKRFG